MTVPRRAGLALRQITTNLLHATDGRDVLFNSPDGWEVEQPWLWWLGPNGTGTGGGPFGHPIPGATPIGGARRHPRRAPGDRPDRRHDRHPALARLPRLDRAAADPAVDRRPPGASASTAGSSTPPSLNETRQSQVDIWGQWILSALWWGDGFIYVPSRDVDGAPKPPLWVLHPDDVELRDGRYWVADVRLDPGEIIHLRGQHPIVDGRGTGVLTRFATELGAVTALRSYVAGAFTAGVPAGYLKTSQPNVTQEQADTLKQRWMTQHGGRRSIAVLNSTTEFHPLTWSPVDTEAADFSRLTLSQIALMFGLPAGMLGGPTGDTLDLLDERDADARAVPAHPAAVDRPDRSRPQRPAPGRHRRPASRSTGCCGPTSRPGSRRTPSGSTKGSSPSTRPAPTRTVHPLREAGAVL